MRAQQERHAAAAAAPNGVTINRHPAVNWCNVVFAERPARTILDALRAAGYGYGAGSWGGSLDRLPECVSALEVSS